ncbi:hypothetical protein CALCODRAFT_516600 [Calocera cornea HHB12733]|uniref:Uncharacterized protein n=1 Tax=Calocera cornea HHB12733 TaxID=1353952 RepID=A0A165GZ76_9BASI|nr:hypothetical protein CALCODRAFT_516600 [Calocera cornea HHB12733]
MSFLLSLIYRPSYTVFRLSTGAKWIVSTAAKLGLGLAKILPFPMASHLSWLLHLVLSTPAKGTTSTIASHTDLPDPMAGYYNQLDSAPTSSDLQVLRIAYENWVTHVDRSQVDSVATTDLLSETELAGTVTSPDGAVDPALPTQQDEVTVPGANAVLGMLGNLPEHDFSASPLSTQPSVLETTGLCNPQVQNPAANDNMPLAQEAADLDVTDTPMVAREESVRVSAIADVMTETPRVEDPCDVNIVDTEITEAGEIIVSTSLPRLTISPVNSTYAYGPPDLSFSTNSPPSSPESLISTPPFVTITLTDYDEEEPDTEVLATSSILMSPLYFLLDHSFSCVNHESSDEESLHANGQVSCYESDDEESCLEKMENELCDGETLVDSFPGHSHPDAPSTDDPPASSFTVKETGCEIQWMFTDPDVPAFEWWIRTERDGSENPEFTYGVAEGWAVAYPEEDYNSVRSEYLSLRGHVIRVDPLPIQHLLEEEEDEEEAHY